MKSGRPLLRVITAAYPGPTEPRRAHFVRGIHRGLSSRFESTVLTPRVHPGDPREEHGDDGIAVTRFPYPVPGRTPKQARLGPVALSRYLLAGRRVGCGPWRSKDRAGAVVAHWVVPSGWIARSVARRTGLPLVLYAHGSDLTRYASSRVARTVAGSILRAARVTVCASEELAGLARSIAKRAIDTRVIPVGVESAFASGGDGASAAPGNAGGDDATRESRFLFVGDLIPSKGVDRLLAAVRTLRASGRSVRLDLYGDGPLRSADASDGVRFHGVAPPKEIASAMGRADALVLPSEREGTPIVVQEALVRRLPVVATAVGGIPALFEERAGWTELAAPTVDELARALGEFDTRRRAGGHPREEMAANEVESLLLGQTVDRFARVLNEVLV